jgi:hypothetical protein
MSKSISRSFTPKAIELNSLVLDKREKGFIRLPLCYLRIIKMAYVCRKPEWPDYVSFYAADATQEYVKNEITERAKRGRFGFWEAIGVLGMIGLEYFKADLNRELCTPFRPMRSLPSYLEAQKPRIRKKRSKRKLKSVSRYYLST